MVFVCNWIQHKCPENVNLILSKSENKVCSFRPKFLLILQRCTCGPLIEKNPIILIAEQTLFQFNTRKWRRKEISYNPHVRKTKKSGK